MLDITAEDIKALGDEDLRTLVGYLCEAELRSKGFSASAVTWGGNQDATDGGLDVRVALSPDTAIAGFVPRAATGFQIKKSDMPPSAIRDEMCPSGLLRPVISDLAQQAGAYILVSSSRSTSDSMLTNRRNAMAESIASLGEPCPLHVDFYDCNRIATWVRDHKSLILWVKRAIGRPIAGWFSYGAWAFGPEGTKGEYLIDDKLRIHTSNVRKVDSDENGISALEGIKQIRSVLSQPRTVVRLVGLSGVGKTRLVQALFDERIGDQALSPALAFYTNMADSPDPQPAGLVAALIAAHTRAILIVDNCAPSLHQRLAELCRNDEGALSVITVEYDIRNDEPEGTEVFRLEPSSIELIEKLVSVRYPHVSDVDIRTVANFSGGNARIAIALAGGIRKAETIAGLADDELFRRLFHQNHPHDESLLLVAQACSLVYSFEGEDVSDADEAELVRLGAVIGKTSIEMFAGVAELARRDLVQKRGVWRAVLPHAIANRLAAIALQSIPSRIITAELFDSAPDRLRKSFSRRLGYLHSSEVAVGIAKSWLASGGLLGSVGVLTQLGRALFENVVPAAPECALSALERAVLGTEGNSTPAGCIRYTETIRKLAYDAASFERCIALLLALAEFENANGNASEGPENIIVSLFPIILSGTHASIEQRINVVRSLVHSESAVRRRTGLKALDALLEGSDFSSGYSLDLGARSRDYGYWPRAHAAVKRWFCLALKLGEDLACGEEPLASEARVIIAKSFRGLWTGSAVYDELERTCHAIAERQFWREGWIAIRQTLNFDSKRFPPEITARLRSLEEFLRPRDVVQQVRGIVLSSKMYDLVDLPNEHGIDESPVDIQMRMESAAFALGLKVAGDPQVFEELLPELVGSEAARLWSFGRGLQAGAADTKTLWFRLVSQFGPPSERFKHAQVFQGYLYALQQSNPGLVNALLDDAVENKILSRWYPLLQASVPIDRTGLARLHRSLALGLASVFRYGNLSYGRACDLISGQDFRDLVLTIASKPYGPMIAFEILHMRLFADRQKDDGYAPEIIEAGRELLKIHSFARRNDSDEYKVGDVVRICLAGDGGAELAQELIGKLLDATVNRMTIESEHQSLVEGLLAVQPEAILNGMLGGSEEERKRGVIFIKNASRHQKNPLYAVCEATLIDWCEQDPGVRYPTVAAIVWGFGRVSDNKPLKWTELALGVLDRCPDRIAVLREYAHQLRPLSWSGSRAAILESNANLLDDLKDYPDPAVVGFVAREKVKLLQEIEAERRSESVRGRTVDERFE